MSPATAAQESRHAAGYDYSPAYEVAEWEAEQEAEADKWEREGRAEMYATLGLTGC